MGDIESYLKQKFDIETNAQLSIKDRNHSSIAPPTYYLRDPMLSDEQNQLLHRPYCGNPFVAPGTIGSKTRRKYNAEGQVGFKDDESFYFDEEETLAVPPGSFEPTSTRSSGQDKRSANGQRLTQSELRKRDQKFGEKLIAKMENASKTKPITIEEEMNNNADMVITEHRAMHTKQGELKELVKLPVKRVRPVYQASKDYQIELPAANVCELVKLLYNMLTSELDSSSMKRLEHDFKRKMAETLNTDERRAKLPKLLSSLNYLIAEFDGKKEDKRTQKVLSLIAAFN